MDTTNPFTIAAGTKEHKPAGGRQRLILKQQKQRSPKPLTLGPRTLDEERSQQEYHRTNPKPLKHQKTNSRAPGFTGAQQEMDRLIDWHDTCPASFAFPPEDVFDDDYYPELHGPPDDPIDYHRYFTSPPKLERRSNHYDE